MAFAASISSKVSKFALTGVFVVALGGVLAPSQSVQAREFPARDETIALSQLPLQGQTTYRAIFEGGPFRHDKDGTVFGNRERLLPRERRGHYREYTVDTPGARTRGARRIVCGGPPTTPKACWYTADHYASFRKIVP
ncbi:MAG: guanine-specific ribonuclease N1 and T1 [Proteobacteria bacterium]|nr:guanine-specific ribonuclease N1 and T1 [Pseudomonadota bacterium]